MYFLPYNLKITYAKIERYGFLLLMLLIMTPIFGVIREIVNILKIILYSFIAAFL